MSDRSPVSRRGLLVGGGLAAAAAGAGVGVAGVNVVGARGDASAPPPLVDFYGPTQAGIATGMQAHAVFNAYDLLPETDAEAARRLLTLITDDSARLTRAEPALNDQEPYLATVAARLTVTVGFGPPWFDKLGMSVKRPAGLTELPSYKIDRLQPAFSGGDLILQLCADDLLVLSHAARQLTKTVRGFARLRWSQHGFSRAAGGHVPHGKDRTSAPRNLMGQIDGTVNPVAGTPDFVAVVWSTEPGWFAGGTTMVLRRIRMELDRWDELDAIGKELAVGRRLETGAPLTGTLETDAADFGATDSSGIPVIPNFAHIARAAPREETDRFLRRPFNYDDSSSTVPTDAGLLFCTFQASIQKQFMPVQQRLAELDNLNDWTVPIGSAVCALPPGCAPGGFVGEGLFS
ncbi:MAG: Dyp-type peroxidase [Propionibacteriales bacterium]|nr:Dyp-type peroxidase [Propionibacteriales bacterium]